MYACRSSNQGVSEICHSGVVRQVLFPPAKDSRVESRFYTTSNPVCHSLALIFIAAESSLDCSSTWPRLHGKSQIFSEASSSHPVLTSDPASYQVISHRKGQPSHGLTGPLSGLGQGIQVSTLDCTAVSSAFSRTFLEELVQEPARSSISRPGDVLND